MAEPAVSASDDPALAKADPQDPLPESNWFWRRLFLFGVATALLVLKGWELRRGEPNWWTDIEILTIVVVYAIAPSAEQFGKMMATVSALRGGVAFRSSQTVSTPGASATTSSSAGPVVGGAAAAQAPAAPYSPAAPEDDELPPDQRVQR